MKKVIKPPTMKDVAKLAGVSVSTVSHVINKTRHVEEETKKKVLSAIKELGYRPNIVARSLRKKTTHTVGLIVSNITNLFYPEVVRGVEDTLLNYKYNLILCNSDENIDKEREYIEVLYSKQVDGIIITPSKSTETRKNLEIFISQNIPVVLVDRRIKGIDTDVVLVDNISGTFLATEYLINLGHKRIGIITGPLDTTTGKERLEGYLQALDKNKIPRDDSLIKEGDFKRDGGYIKGKELLSLEDPPTAIISSNNLMTLGLISAIQELELKIPDDLSVISFDDMEWFKYFSPSITAIYQPSYELGKNAGLLLLERLRRRRKKAKEVILPTKLIIRESCAPPKKS
ncbi:MAG: LacI family transcriptional regulator [Dictyoglomus sp.]|nr:LacI family transcriptional regulator [Dictyoglomus sp.]MDW8187921.1 LacI family DNA-binding transcriptional regulator [Dictyoglomus sp.]